jgi:hypothetical protein
MDFYNFYDETHDNNFAIVNGANHNLTKGDGGTNKGVSIINENFKDQLFNINYIEEIFNPTNIELNDKIKPVINKQNQIINLNYGNKMYKYPAGIVFRINSKIKSNPIKIVYHVKGINLYLGEIHSLSKRIELEVTIQELVKLYYQHILNDFLFNSNLKFIYIPPISGINYGGSKITEDTLFETVFNFINSIDCPKRSITIILGLNENNYKLHQLYTQHNKTYDKTPKITNKCFKK